eukprot:SAG22_NODE_2335_length_2702_cov_10.861698_2_plen_109_part_00
MTTLKTSWSDAQYRKYQAFKEEQKAAADALLWKPEAALRPPPKLQFKQRLWVTGPAATDTIVETLETMGFTREQAEAAAKATKGGSVEDAAAFLLGGAANSENRRRRR